VKKLNQVPVLCILALCSASLVGCTTNDSTPESPADAGLGDAAPDTASLPDAAIPDAAPPEVDAAAPEVDAAAPDADAAAPDAAAPDAALCDPAQRTVVHVTQGITAPTTWGPCTVYVIDNSIQIAAALTIQPDTIVKFKKGTSLSVNLGGSIVADGASAATPCVFTSIADDTSGGDTNGDAGAPARGDWDYIQLRDNGSVFNFCRFLYGGGNMPYTGTMLLADGVSATIKNSTFAHNQGGTLTDARAAALNAGAAAAAAVITGNRFFDNDMPLVIGGSVSIDDSNVFAESDAAGATTNKYNGIFWNGSYTLSGNVSWTNTHVPVVILSPVGIAAGAALTIGDKVTVKLDKGQRMDVAGRLLANAATGILFTSILDDAGGGDTNGDAAATKAAPGDWGYITISADGSVLNRVRFSYGGSAKPYHATVEVANANTPPSATITRCTFSYNAGGTLADNRAAALNVGGAAAGMVITDNVFYANDMPLVINGLVNLDGSNVFHSADATPLTNKLNGIFMDGVQHRVTGSPTWSNTEVAYVLYDTVLSVETGGTLTLGNGVVVKAETAGRIDLMGSLQQGTNDSFTSLRDDTLLGDTNGDAAATSPVKGDWVGINICLGGPCNWATWANILYALHP
jgi:hypothetical protein